MIPSDVSGVGPDDRLLAEAVRAFEEDGAPVSYTHLRAHET